MDHAQRVNQLSDARQELDQQIGMIDRLIIDLERKTLKRETRKVYLDRARWTSVTLEWRSIAQARTPLAGVV